ncbi:MAG TPA: RIP metalloprotease RseP [Acetobacteraceae bacterium]|nr:RIP metalloprotease RseP [Acetobacteraceae bacterium]
MPAVLQSTLAFLVVLGVLVFVHELGHYLAARLVRVHVEVFSIGFGPAIATWRDRVGTVWKLGWLPLGGYVKLHGHERPEVVVADEPREPSRLSLAIMRWRGRNPRPAEPRPVSVEPTGNPNRWIPGRVFHEKPVASRALVVAAGPIANFLLAMVLFALLFATAGRPLILPIAGDVLPGSAAERAGIRADDRIVSIAGAPIASFEDIQRIIAAHPAETLPITIRRGHATLDLPVLTDARDSGGRKVGMLGIRGGQVEYQRLSLPAALVGGVTQTWQVTSETVVGVAEMISGRRGTEDLGGPLRIAQLSGQVAQLGLASLISFIAVLSVNLGLINLFPIPVLDGGHLLFYLAEAIRGRPVPPRAQEYGFRAGLALIAGLFILATWNDLTHLGMFH